MQSVKQKFSKKLYDFLEFTIFTREQMNFKDLRKFIEGFPNTPSQSHFQSMPSNKMASSDSLTRKESGTIKKTLSSSQ